MLTKVVCQLRKWHKGVDARANVRLYLRGQKQTTYRELHMSYKELQSALKNYRNTGVVLQVKLNATKVALQAEYNRITGNSGSKQETQEIDELQMLRDELAAAKATIAKQAARIQELEQQQQEPEPEQHEQGYDWDGFWDAVKEEGANDPDAEVKLQAAHVNGELIAEAMQRMRTLGKKATIKWLKSLAPQFHSDTCKLHGNKFNAYQWEGYIKLIDSIRDNEFVY